MEMCKSSGKDCSCRIGLMNCSGKNALTLLKVLSEAIGRSFIETALDS